MNNFKAYMSNETTPKEPSIRTIVFSPYVPGTAEKLIDTARTEEERETLLGEYYYLRVDYPEAVKHFKRCIDTDNDAINAFNLWHYANTMANCGDIKTFYALTKRLMGMPFNPGDDLIIKISQSILENTLFLPEQCRVNVQDLLSMNPSELAEVFRVYIQYLRIPMCVYKGEFVGALSIMKTIMYLAPFWKYPLSFASFGLQCAEACLLMGELKEARFFIRAACRMLKPDKFLSPFTTGVHTHFKSLKNMVGEEWPEAAQFMEEKGNICRRNRISAHNKMCDDILATSLTQRQYEMALLAARGKSNKEIAQELGISENTVRMTLHSVYVKLDIKKRSELAKYVFSFNIGSFSK